MSTFLNVQGRKSDPSVGRWFDLASDKEGEALAMGLTIP